MKQITNLLQPHFKSTERSSFFFYYSEDFIFKEIQPTLWNLAGCKTVGKFEYFKELFMMTSLRTDTRGQASSAGVRGRPQGRVMYTQVGSRSHAARALKQAETSLLSFWGRESVCPHSSPPPSTPPPPGLCVFHSTKPLHCLAFEDQRAFWTVAPCFTAVRKVAWAPSKEFFSFFLFFFFFINHRGVCVNTARNWREYI